ncbi:MAG: hypothetical protein Q9M36_00610 [Sulfurovum sp.]|nr:hypothetical protein [Sulfurovum sp.]
MKIKKDLNSLKLDMAIQENELLKRIQERSKEYEELSIGGVQERDAEYTEKSNHIEKEREISPTSNISDTDIHVRHDIPIMVIARVPTPTNNIKRIEDDRIRASSLLNELEILGNQRAVEQELWRKNALELMESVAILSSQQEKIIKLLKKEPSKEESEPLEKVLKKVLIPLLKEFLTPLEKTLTTSYKEANENLLNGMKLL